MLLFKMKQNQNRAGAAGKPGLLKRRSMMNKIKIKSSFILLFLLMVGFNTSLSAKGDRFKLFFNLSTGGFKAFTFGAGAELKLLPSLSLRPSVDMVINGGRIFYFDAVLSPKSSKKLQPFFTVGYLDYYFEGSDRHDRDEVKSFTVGGGIHFPSKKKNGGASLGVRIATADGSAFPIIYLSLNFLRL
jgi:hypothetical protein